MTWDILNTTLKVRCSWCGRTAEVDTEYFRSGYFGPCPCRECIRVYSARAAQQQVRPPSLSGQPTVDSD